MPAAAQAHHAGGVFSIVNAGDRPPVDERLKAFSREFQPQGVPRGGGKRRPAGGNGRLGRAKLPTALIVDFEPVAVGRVLVLQDFPHPAKQRHEAALFHERVDADLIIGPSGVAKECLRKRVQVEMPLDAFGRHHLPERLAFPVGAQGDLKDAALVGEEAGSGADARRLRSPRGKAAESRPRRAAASFLCVDPSWW